MTNGKYDAVDLTQQTASNPVEAIVSAALCNSCGTVEGVSQISKAYFICFACAVDQGRRMTDAWLGDYCEDDDAH